MMAEWLAGCSIWLACALLLQLTGGALSFSPFDAPTPGWSYYLEAGYGRASTADTATAAHPPRLMPRQHHGQHRAPTAQW